MRYLDQMGIPSRDSPAVLLLGDLQIVAYLSPVVSTAVSRIVQLATRQVMLPRNRVAKKCRPLGTIFRQSTQLCLATMAVIDERPKSPIEMRKEKLKIVFPSLERRKRNLKFLSPVSRGKRETLKNILIFREEKEKLFFYSQASRKIENYNNLSIFERRSRNFKCYSPKF